ncbi:MAG: NAD-dependent epimerase/dehydratase family protein [Gammaproteobacteria bacterium]
MRVIVTGAGGFVGRQFVASMTGHDVVAIDSARASIPDLPNVHPIVGDITDVQVLALAFAGGCDAVVHLATVPGGAAEQDPELAWRVNIDGTMELAQMAGKVGERPRFVFASSIAVFGDPIPAGVDDATPLAPRLLYAGHKAMMEQWLAVLSRRGDIDALSLRLPGVVARPQGPSGMKSAFLSDSFHALRAGRKFVMPVSPDATSWLSSVNCVADNLRHALFLDPELTGVRALTLPALRVRMGDMIDEIARQTHATSNLVSYEPDVPLEMAFGRQPALTTHLGDQLGFSHDTNLAALVETALAQLAVAN